MLEESKQNQRIVRLDMSLLQALKRMDKTGFRSLLVVDNNELFAGILSIGDIQRAIIKNIDLETLISAALRHNPRIASKETPLDQIKSEMQRFRMEFMPVIDAAKHIYKIYLWDELFVNKKLPPKKQFDLPVVIMAGGFGSRLKPLTNVFPKPLIPMGEKTMIEQIFERFANHGCRDFYVSVNYKAELIEFYLRNQNLPYRIAFFKEERPMGTAGSLSLLKNKINQPFFVTNCDILIEQDYTEILDYHKDNKNDITIVAAMKHYPIPYGIVNTGENGAFISIQEKPELTFKINAGMYILEPAILNNIPENSFYHITQLIESIKKIGRKVGVFPVSESSWKDIGEWSEYLRNNVLN
jgi:dTDP-glucose pyrophosphorylase